MLTMKESSLVREPQGRQGRHVQTLDSSLIESSKWSRASLGEHVRPLLPQSKVCSPAAYHTNACHGRGLCCLNHALSGAVVCAAMWSFQLATAGLNGRCMG